MYCINLFSGGLDSTVTLYWLKKVQHAEVKCLGINYGQKHLKELEFGKKICEQLKIEYKIIELEGIQQIFESSALIGKNISIPEGHYEDKLMKTTIVPNRNMIMISLAFAWAININYNTIAYSPHLGDRLIYPDCRIEFVDGMRKVLNLAMGNGHKIKLLTPFIDKDKSDIIKIGLELEVPFELTWTCYKGQKRHCGKCGACVERQLAFKKLNIIDSVTYN